MSSELLSKHFREPNNIGEVSEPSSSARTGSLTCGALVQISIQVDDERKIVDAKFKAAGCSYLVAGCSLLTDEIIGKPTAEAASMMRSEPVETLATIPAANQHCVALACNVILSAISNYSDAVRAEWIGDDALICTCFGVSERQIENVVESEHLITVADVTRVTNAGAGCGSCYKLIEDILDDHNFQKMNSATGRQTHSDVK